MAPDLPTRSTEQQSRQSRPRSAQVIVSAALLGLFLALDWVLWTAGRGWLKVTATKIDKAGIFR